jgi:Amt family ammonium transporter
MKALNKLGAGLASLAVFGLAPIAALASGTPPTPDKGDVAWMSVATLLVTLMIVPGLALFYGGLVRAKNMLSVLMQVMMVFSLIVVRLHAGLWW